MTDSTADFTDEQIQSMDPNVLVNEIDKVVDENYGQGQPQYDTNQYDPNQVSQEGGQEQQQQYVDPQVYKDTYDRITAPFKAAGREFQVRNVDEAISLMQKGVDYTRKQQALKPRLMEMRTLEEQGMLGNNLNYAIDLFNGNPQAIAKLIKDKGIDINSIMPQPTTDEFGQPVPQKETPYTPNNYSVSPEKFALKEVMDDLQSANKMQPVLDTLRTFDQDSLAEFAKSPKYLTALSNLIDSGMYDSIRSELDHARVVDDPAIRGLNDFQAIDVIGNRLVQEAQQFMQNQPQQQPQQPQPQPQYVQPQQQYIPQPQQPPVYQQQRQILDQRKQGVAPVRGTQAPVKPMYDPLNCSDEEFSKINLNDILRM